MRVIAGSHKGRRLLGPRGPGLRPTPDRVKEALFSILGDRVLGARVLDLYAGTGAVGIEALSRGARTATFVDAHAASLHVLLDNLNRCGFADAAAVHRCEAEAFLRRHPGTGAYDIVFADPPYQTACVTRLLSLLAEEGVAAPDATVIIEHATRAMLPSEAAHWSRIRQYRYGDTSLSLYARAAAEDLPS